MIYCYLIICDIIKYVIICDIITREDIINLSLEFKVVLHIIKSWRFNYWTGLGPIFIFLLMVNKILKSDLGLS